jgi:membrane protein implicated in regulation of membrane protease activity
MYLVEPCTGLQLVLVVGAHFLPFARAFGAAVFTGLGWMMVAIAAAGGLAVLLLGPHASAWTGVAAGFALLAFSGAALWRTATKRGRRDQLEPNSSVRRAGYR